MTKTPTVMIVDDAAENRLVLQMILEDDYEIFDAMSGKDCLEQIKASAPDLILLDVNMPGMSGYEVCSQLRKQDATRSLPVIFVSALDSPEERLAGFEAGGDEYVTKPVEKDELLKKVKYRLEHKQEVTNARKEATDAMNVAMEAMTSSSELGRIIQFVEVLNETDTPFSIGQAISQMIQEFSLNVCVMVAGPDPIYVDCMPDSLEGKLMKQFQHHSERIVSAGARTIFRSNDIVVLIKNMPVDDANLYGRLKDHLIVLVDMATNRLLAILVQLTLDEQRSNIINNIISLTEKQIKLTSEKLISHEKIVRNTMQNMLSDMEGMLYGLGLEEDQEKSLMKLADNATGQLEESNRSTNKLDADLGIILESLYDLMASESSKV